MTDEEGDGRTGSGDVGGPGNVGGSTGADDTRLARRWRALDRGWQALLLGLSIVAVQLALQSL